MPNPSCLLAIALVLCSAAMAQPIGKLENAERIYADLNDASSVISAIDSGLFSEYRGKNRSAWQQQLASRRASLAKELASIDAQQLPPSEARVLDVLRHKLTTFTEGADAGAAHVAHCSDANAKQLALEPLSQALEACFTEIANNLEFERQRIDRASALGQLGDLDAAKRRKTLFLSFLPLWKAVNGENETDSPYRRLIALAAADAQRKQSSGSAVDAAARTLGVTKDQVEQWLIQILETWGTATAGEVHEPWDYRYASGAVERTLAGKISRDSMLQIDHRFYRDLGVDLDALGVLYDLEPRANKSSVAYTDFLIHGRSTSQGWQPTVARVLASYRSGSLGSLNELVHENGHAVQLSAIRTRPAYMDWNDDLFVEAFADVSSWSLYEPAWQQRYLGTQASESDSIRGLFSAVMLDVAWALFETRMLREPKTDPNVLWTEITQRYLHIAPHPQFAWWAVRGQLVESPGYMVNYGAGAVLIADLRATLKQRIGEFDTGNARWYSYLSQNLLRFGSERDTAQLLKSFLGRPVSDDALLQQLRRLGKAGTAATPAP